MSLQLCKEVFVHVCVEVCVCLCAPWASLLSATLTPESHYSHVLYPILPVIFIRHPAMTEVLTVCFQHYLLLWWNEGHLLACSPNSKAPSLRNSTYVLFARAANCISQENTMATFVWLQNAILIYCRQFTGMDYINIYGWTDTKLHPKFHVWLGFANKSTQVFRNCLPKPRAARAWT